MKTQEEIMLRIKELQGNDFLGFETSDLYGALTANNVIEMLLHAGSDKSKEELEKELVDHKPYETNEQIIAEMKRYMDFAVGKAVNHRGISASRSVGHYRSWVWLINDQESFDFLNDDSNYQNYGAPMLKYIAEKYGCQLPEGEKRIVFDAMANGEICPWCESGDYEGCDQ